MKTCTGCGTSKPLDQYYRDRSAPDGRCARCKVCKSAQNRKWDEANAERMREYQQNYHRDWYARNREKKLAQNAEWSRENPEARTRHVRASCRRNSAARVERTMAWREENRDHYNKYMAEYCRRREVLKTGADAEKIDREVVWDRDSGICNICGDPCDSSDWHLDHVIPLARGGSHTYDNVAVSHPTCNMQKGSKLLQEIDL